MNRHIDLHTFHIPVMGLAYTVDTPAKVARYGISSVVSIIEDTLIERMRQYYYQKLNEPYFPIHATEPDYRAKRITDYLNLLNKIVTEQIEKLKASTFEAGSDLTLYFEMLPETSLLKKIYVKMQQIRDRQEQKRMEQELRDKLYAGSIDVNIMTKLDNERYHSDGTLIEDGSDAVAALRGYANSELSGSSIIFSAGMNPRLFSYAEKQIDVFTKMKNGEFVKKIVLKVSDFRSSIIQGKYLAKRGLWVSEFRIESGLNCGGHTFASDGYLLGPILEEFKTKRTSLENELFEIYKQALIEKGKTVPESRPNIKVTVQGGIGTYEEDEFLRKHYDVDATGWGTPFLLVPEAVTVDPETLKSLSDATEDDIVLSNTSPLGVRFNYLKGISGEKEKYQLAEEGRPGSPCSEKLLQANTEFTDKPICTASVTYFRKKIQQIRDTEPDVQIQAKKISALYEKECLCIGLSNTAIRQYHLPPIGKTIHGVTVCPGPNLAYFDKVVSLKEMIDHIYGRTNLLKEGYRPHVFIKEIKIYLEYLNEQMQGDDLTDAKRIKYYQSFCKNMEDAIVYYSSISSHIAESNQFTAELQQAGEEITQIKATIETNKNN